MTVIVLERIPASVRGELTRWMLEIHSGVFIGRLNSAVRVTLWRFICERLRSGAGLIAYQADNEQGFIVTAIGQTDRLCRQVEGLTLVTVPVKPA